MGLSKTLQAGQLLSELLVRRADDLQRFSGHLALLSLATDRIDSGEGMAYVDGSRGDSIDANPQGAAFRGRVLGQSNQRMFSRGIRGHVRLGAKRVGRANVDNRPLGALLLDLLQLVLVAQSSARQGNINERAPVWLVKVDQGGRIRVSGGIVDRDIQFPEGADGDGDQILDLVRLGDVRCHKSNLSQGGKLLRDLFSLLRLDVCNDHLCARPKEDRGSGLAHSLGGAGYDGNLVLEDGVDRGFGGRHAGIWWR